MNQKGFVLITTMVGLLLMMGVLSLIHIQVIASLSTLSNVDRQLRAISLAESGIEYSRALLPRVELASLMPGPDGRFCAVRGPSWRNPIALEVARSEPVDKWTIRCDDGLPSYQGSLLLPSGFEAKQGGRFFLRFTNDPDEGGNPDEDGVIVVRSLGIVPSAWIGPQITGLRNHVALIEATFRKEYAFHLRSALTVAAKSGSVRCEGSRFDVSGERLPAVGLVPLSGNRLIADVLNAISPAQQSCFRGLGSSPSVLDVGSEFHSRGEQRQLLTAEFWAHFEENLPIYGKPLGDDEELDQGLLVALKGGDIRQSLTGILVARGDLRFSGDATLEGLLIHLGGGTLTLSDRSVIRGAVWMSSFEGNESDECRVRLSISGSAEVLYDEDSLLSACRFLPVTQLGWRMIFPEMLR